MNKNRNCIRKFLKSMQTDTTGGITRLRSMKKIESIFGIYTCLGATLKAPTTKKSSTIK